MKGIPKKGSCDKKPPKQAVGNIGGKKWLTATTGTKGGGHYQEEEGGSDLRKKAK